MKFNLKSFKKNAALLAGCIFIFSLAVAKEKTVADKQIVIASPDGKIKLLVNSINGKLTYSVEFNKITVIDPSGLGLVVDGKVYGNNVALAKVEKYALNQTYPYRGVHSVAVNNFKGAKINVSSAQTPFTLDARVFNNGVAFRYIINKQGHSVTEKDSTAFILPGGSVVWSQPNNKHYEARYTRKTAEEFKKDELIGPPATIILPGEKAFMAITEGGNTDFAGMSLIADGNRKLLSNLTGNTQKEGKIETSWRIIEIGKDLNSLVNCDIIANVSPAFDPKLFPKGYDSDWIKPGRSVWSWLAGRGPVSLANMKRFTDLAAALGFEYNLVDEGWSNWRDGTRNQWDMMKELVDYSAAKGVKIWAWKAYPNRGGIPGIKDPAQRKEFFKKCKELGIAGLKVDFFDSESQEIIDFYQAALKDAAEYQLMMNFHGANKPTGEARTWPNEMSREAIKGLESRPPWGPTNAVLPFTRYLAGHADFTPVHFGDRLGEVTWAHHVATVAIFTTPFLCIGADPQSILDNPTKDMIKSIPPTWDETIVLPQSKIGELVVYARRKGNTWFLAALSGVNETKTFNVDLSFLKKGNYTLSALKDDKSKQAGVEFEDSNVSAKSTVSVSLNPTGGYVAKLSENK